MNAREAVQTTRAFYCLDCGKCTAVCPISLRDENYSPRMNVYHTVSGQNGGEDARRTLNQCLTCLRCSLVCPSDVKYSEFTRKMRIAASEEGLSAECSHGGVVQSLARLLSRDGKDQNRLSWVPEKARVADKGKLLYFTGCLPWFDAYFTHLEADTLSIARDTLRILNSLGEEPVLMKDEVCCGHDLYWSGDEEGAARLARRNVEAIREAGAEQVVSACPECVQTMREVWPRLAGPLPFTAVHLSEYLAEKKGSGDLRLTAVEGAATFHDPCRLGRFLGAYDAPRDALGDIYGDGLREMAHSGPEAICCGTSGWQHCNAVSKQIQTSRLREAVEAGAETLITACPKCQIHLSCAQAAEDDESLKSLRVRDYANVVAEAIEGGDLAW